MGDRVLTVSRKEADDSELSLVVKILKFALSNNPPPGSPSPTASPSPSLLPTLATMMRDEIYCQIVKQLTHNPNLKSQHKGWDLVSIFVQYFPPSQTLYPHLLNFFQEHLKIDEDPKIPNYAKFCTRKLKKIVDEGAKGRVPSQAELKGMLGAPFMKHVFGVTLSDIMEIQRDIDPKAEIPLVLTLLTKAVLDLNGHQTEGIFRVPGDTAEVTQLKFRIESGTYHCDEIYDPHVPGSLLKLWMRELASPIIPSELYMAAVEAAKADVPEDSCAVTRKLPALNRKVVYYVIEYLRKVAEPENIPKTKMNIDNLAMVFAPNFLKCPSEDPEVIFNTQKHQQTFVKHLITDLDCDEDIPDDSSGSGLRKSNRSNPSSINTPVKSTITATINTSTTTTTTSDASANTTTTHQTPQTTDTTTVISDQNKSTDAPPKPDDTSVATTTTPVAVQSDGEATQVHEPDKPKPVVEVTILANTAECINNNNTTSNVTNENDDDEDDDDYETDDDSDDDEDEDEDDEEEEDEETENKGPSEEDIKQIEALQQQMTGENKNEDNEESHTSEDDDEDDDDDEDSEEDEAADD
eukprot:TRINITY_DN1_c6_g1_i2.p1 TRINITY_DN1_c6_g1~~TRINITY_DN1_c6_g1_i2.p1  ORF type:complete len:579 (-),score=201.13 TRINITY_DN1_c6_g1_i2:224-1960(-)